MTIAKAAKHLFLVTTVALASASAQASVVQFENLVPVGNTYSYTNGPDTVDGMVFSYSIAYFMHNYQTTDPRAPSDPTGTLFTYEGVDVHMAQLGGAAFSLNAFDAGIYRDLPNGTINVTGDFAGGGSITTAFNIAPNAFNTFTFGNAWTNLQQVTFRVNNTSFIQYDNIVVDGATVPEPSSSALILLALGALGFAARRSASKNTA